MLLDGTAVLLLPVLLVAIRREQNPIYRRPNVDSLLLLLAFLWYLRVRSNAAARCCERYAAAV